jgi:GWxTD domain-containing protein
MVMKTIKAKYFMTMKSLKSMTSIVLFLLIGLSCNNSRDIISSKNSNKVLEREQKFLSSETIICHKNANSSELHYKINTKGFLYKKTSNEINFTAKFVIKCKLYLEGKSKTLVDTANVFLSDVDELQREKIMLGKVNFNTVQIGKYEMDLQIIDLNGSANKVWKLNFERKEKNDVNYFYLITAKDSIPVFTQVLKPNTEYYLINNSPETDAVRIEHYSNSRNLPPPIFSEDENTESNLSLDSFYILNTKKSNKVKYIKEGIYKFYLGEDIASTYKRGVLFNKTFPKVGDYEVMIASMRFILNKEEYKNLVAATDKQAAVEKQWLTFAGSADRAEKVIKSYYGRVESANRDFTTSIEGWKTDKGLVKIIFGAPDRINNLYNREIWVYYIGGNYNQVAFEFYREDSNKEYELTRSQNFKDLWYYAVDTWRQGRIFLRD